MEINGNPKSSWFDVKSVPADYIFPQEERPQNLNIPVSDSIPVIDLAKETATEGDINQVEAILAAAQEFGFFQVINHGVPENTIYDAVGVLKEFFQMPSKDTTSIVPQEKGWIYTSNVNYAKDGVHLWRENLKHSCHPLEECVRLWPETPTRYREVIAAYIVEIQKLSLRILDMISEGLGLGPEYFDSISEVQLFSSNFYPPCPDPSLTLGVIGHHDPSFITLLFQGDVAGLQVLKDGQWINVGTVPNAFLVNVGNQLEIISNGKLRSAEHRVVTNSRESRTSIATFVNPSPECVIEPAKILVNELQPSRYNSSLYGEYVHRNTAFGNYTAAFQDAKRS